MICSRLTNRRAILRVAPASSALGGCTKNTTAVMMDQRFTPACYNYKTICHQSSQKTWIEHPLIPSAVRPYLYLARMDKPIGTMLLFWPCLWGVVVGTGAGVDPWSTLAITDPTTVTDIYVMIDHFRQHGSTLGPILGHGIVHSLPEYLQPSALSLQFLLGAFIMRGAGCTINDLWDRDFDKHVTRTMNRPIASGKVSVTKAGIFLCGQLSAGLALLVTLPINAVYTAICAMPLVIIYPAMKRVTYFPQFILGLTFNWGALVGFAATAPFQAPSSAFSLLSIFAPG